MKIIKLTAPNNAAVYFNADEIVTWRPTWVGEAGNTHILTSAGERYVRESAEYIADMVRDPVQ